MEKYFKDLDAMYTFCLLELDGKIRMDKLKITRYLFSSKTAAKKWYDNIRQHLTNQEAIDKLDELYSSMAK